jgi:hypothetical protein
VAWVLVVSKNGGPTVPLHLILKKPIGDPIHILRLHLRALLGTLLPVAQKGFGEKRRRRIARALSNRFCLCCVEQRCVHCKTKSKTIVIRQEHVASLSVVISLLCFVRYSLR